MYSENLSVSEVKANLFEKRTVVELTENEMTKIDGGTGTYPTGTSSVPCIQASKALYDAIHDFFN